jgi:hypothetical protein
MMVAEEKYEFKSGTRNKLVYLLLTGIVLLGLGIALAMTGGGHGEEHATAGPDTGSLLASAETQEAAEGSHVGGHSETAVWLKRVYSTLWMNSVFFAGIGVIGLFFVAIQYAAQAGWSAGLLRIPLAMGNWIPVAAVIMLASWFVVKGDVFHWTHASLYSEGGDAILTAKSPYFFWPLEAGGFPAFFILRMVLFFGLWYMFFMWIRREMAAEDLEGGTQHWYNARKYSAIFLVIFAVSSSVSAWDWVMSIDPHWFSTMMGWYVFASWWVTGLAVITLIVVNLKDSGYLKVVNANHLHDLGKFVFAFSIFWTYIWFSQFMLIYYANIPEETVYFINRIKNGPYSWVFYANIILCFVLPFLLLMTRDSKRHISMLKVICPVVVIGHWFDFYNMITPGVMKTDGQVGFIEIGMTLIFAAAFLFVTLSSLARLPLVGRNHPMLAESLHHHI